MDTEEVDVPTKKAPKSRRTWKKSEEDALMKCMVAEFSDKWKGDLGFRSGFFTLFEKELEKVIPESRIRENPHIESKVKGWKTLYYRIVDIINLSGFGWDHDNKRIDVDAKVWDEYAKAHPKKTNGLYGRSFPYFNDWQTVFGNDRATGVLAEDPFQMAQDDPTQGDCEGLGEDVGYEPYFVGDEFLDYVMNETTPLGSTPPVSTPLGSTAPPFTPSGSTAPRSAPSGSAPSGSAPSGSTPPSSVPPGYTPLRSAPPGSTPVSSARRPTLRTSTPQTSTPPANAGTKKGKKRSRLSEEELSMHASLEKFMIRSDGHMEKIANSMGHSKDLSVRRTSIPDALEKLDLTMAHRFKLAAIISVAEERVDQFYGTRDDEKQAWVDLVLDGQIFGPV